METRLQRPEDVLTTRGVSGLVAGRGHSWEKPLSDDQRVDG